MLRYHKVGDKVVHLNGWRKDSPDHRDKVFAGSAVMDLPPAADLRLSSHMPAIVDQGALGSCTCNSSTSAVEFALKREGETAFLSRLWLYDRVREYEDTPLSEDSGAQIRNVMKVLAQQGCALEQSWPYDINKSDIDPPPELSTEAAKHKILVYYRCSGGVLPSLPVVKAAISQGFPVVGGFQVPENAMSPQCASTGEVQFPGELEQFVGGHAVMFVAYDDAKGCLCFANSWGDSWGDKGYGYLPYEFFEKGLADDFWSIRRVEE